MNRGDTFVDFSNKFPVLNIKGGALDPALQELQGSVFGNSYQKNQVSQLQTKGHWAIDGDSSLDFGLSLTEVKNRSAFANVQRDTWGGATSAADYPDSVWKADSIRPYFGKISGSDSSALFNQFFTFDFETVRALAAKAAGDGSLYMPSNVFTTDRRVTEKSQSAYLQSAKMAFERSKDDEILTPVMGDGRFAASLPLFGGLTDIEIIARIAGEKNSDPYVLVAATIAGLAGAGGRIVQQRLVQRLGGRLGDDFLQPAFALRLHPDRAAILDHDLLDQCAGADRQAGLAG